MMIKLGKYVVRHIMISDVLVIILDDIYCLIIKPLILICIVTVIIIIEKFLL